MIKIIRSNICLIVALTLPCLAQAATFKVSSPYVEKGKTKVEWQGYYGVDDDDSKNGAWKQNYILGYGVTDYWKTQIKTVYEKGGEGDDPDITATSFENTFRLSPEGTYFDLAVKIDYAHFFSGQTADNAAAKLIVARNAKDFLHIINFKIAHNVGEPDEDFTSGIAWSTKYKYSAEFQPGFEIYNDFGAIDKRNAFRNQNRSIGPVINGRINGIGYQAGYLFGLTDDTPDGTLKISLEYQF